MTAWQVEPSHQWPQFDVDLTDVSITADRYLSAEFFASEWEGMWTKVWLLMGRAAQMPEPGDYQAEEIGPESVIMVRQQSGEIRSFYNVCQHRGSRLTFAEEGSVSRFVCPYHSWEYETDGSLVKVQDVEDFAEDPCATKRLVEIRTEVFAGFVWINMNPEAETLQEFLGPLWNEWAAYEPDDWPRVTALTARVDCNWKIIQDNFCESYHLPSVHPQLMESHEESYRYSDFQMSQQGHNRMIMPGATPSITQYGESPPLPEVLQERLRRWDLDPADFVDDPLAARRAIQQQMRALGPERGHAHYDNLHDLQLTDSHHYNLFPNCSVTFAADGVLLQRMRPHATDPQKCLFDHWYYGFTPASEKGVLDVATNIRIDGAGGPGGEVEHEVFDFGDRSMGLIPDQDLSIATGQQLGMRSRGFTEPVLAGQEDRVAWFHKKIDITINQAKSNRASKNNRAIRSEN